MIPSLPASEVQLEALVIWISYNSHHLTPQKVEDAHVIDLDNKEEAREEIDTEREKEAREAEDGLVRDTHVPLLTIPCREALKSKADSVAKAVTDNLEHLINCSTNELQRDNSKASDYKAMVSYLKSSKMELNEAEMYAPIKALFAYIASEIKNEADQSNYRGSFRTFETYEKPDQNSDDADDSRRIDLGLQLNVHDGNDGGSDDPYSNLYSGSKIADRLLYSRLLAIIEVKASVDDQPDAYGLLLMYTRNVYLCQHDRRFVWGFTICNRFLRACVFSNDIIYSTFDIDLATQDGRKELVTLLCNMSFCSIEQLGYDPTIRYNGSFWEIDVFDDRLGEEDSGFCQTFKIDDIYENARRTFGRHTRCFACSRITNSSVSSPSSPTLFPPNSCISAPLAMAGTGTAEDGLFIVKDGWANAQRPLEDGTQDKMYDEVAIISRITNVLATENDVKGCYPMMICGGIVRTTDENGRYSVLDTTDNTLKDLCPESLRYVVYREHKRIAMMPVGYPIYNIGSVDELIIVAADVMRVYMRIWEKTKILHRDISNNNILFTRSGSQIRGVLIDFDCALDTDAHNASRPIQQDIAGTLPFMSILNLEDNQEHPRTILDDWESMIYLLCWLGTFGN
ncbi:hypothetical protein GGI07_001675 [Coemansia sp. Benny D115]|nr:hypothetical protein GGI07_001675 [Coemansia sp. Benny D115]